MRSPDLHAWQRDAHGETGLPATGCLSFAHKTFSNQRLIPDRDKEVKQQGEYVSQF